MNEKSHLFRQFDSVHIAVAHRRDDRDPEVPAELHRYSFHPVYQR